MIRSMTGFGRSEEITPEYKLSVEIKAVNHRYLDLSIKMPKKFNYFEAAIRSLLKEYIQRGKVDVYINYENYTDEKLCLRYNHSLAAEYMDAFKEMQEQFGIKNDISVSALARMPEVLAMEQESQDEEQMWQQLSKAILPAAERFVESRVSEGEKLKVDLLSKLDFMEEQVAFIEARFPAILDNYRKKLQTKVADLLKDTSMDENRIAAEVTIYADKICVDEEMVRLRSHIASVRKELETGGTVGRKLDFIAQELNREANTTLSKSTDMEISDKAILLKTEIEKVREQIQNIE